ncbi:DUF2975 domain-containing protein [Mucilaginibacter ginkgonis]|uniref:DUF2975 domain-containing protein n=1 Tax=Mucilaginibacter ginkgonis TaxID=2682091 RepID=A0A6I4HZ19_9SPHI|nr:DUF2975 domain-containing protein [Mucilaginibacter ginkgonis]QQL48261.1 DUF2975 domain-containing protein [Mucilaginibacter ginkgonis]
MKRISTVFLQGVLVLIGVITLTILIVFPTREGRAADLDLFHIYADPFILFVYASSSAFFTGLYKAFKLLGYIGRNRVFSTDAVLALRSIKLCSLALAGCILLTAVFIRIFHAKGDDPAGFMMLCMTTAFATIVVATAAAVFEKVLQSAIDIKSENDLTI